MNYFYLSRFRYVACAGFVALALLTGCRRGHESQDAAVRLINAAPVPQDLSVAVDGQVVWNHSGFGDNTGYHGIKEGSYKIAINSSSVDPHGTASKDFECVKGKAYTFVNFGMAGGQPKVKVFVENLNAPVPRGKSRIQFINGGPDSGNLDVVFDNIVGFANIPYGTRSAPIMPDSGAYDVRLNKANELRALTGPDAVHFLPGRSYTLVAMGSGTSGHDAVVLQTYADGR